MAATDVPLPQTPVPKRDGNLRSDIRSVLSEMLDDMSKSDTHLHCNGKNKYFVRYIISSRSAYFANLFDRHKDKMNTFGQLRIDLPEEDPEVLSRCIDFCYRDTWGALPGRHSVLANAQMYIGGFKYQIPDLCSAARDIFRQCLHDPEEEEAIRSEISKALEIIYSQINKADDEIRADVEEYILQNSEKLGKDDANVRAIAYRLGLNAPTPPYLDSIDQLPAKIYLPIGNYAMKPAPETLYCHSQGCRNLQKIEYFAACTSCNSSANLFKIADPIKKVWFENRASLAEPQSPRLVRNPPKMTLPRDGRAMSRSPTPALKSPALLQAPEQAGSAKAMDQANLAIREVEEL